MLYIIWIAAAIVFIVAWIFRGYVFNIFYAFRIITGAFLDVICQLFIDLSKINRIFKRRRQQPNLDQSEDFYWRD